MPSREEIARRTSDAGASKTKAFPPIECTPEFEAWFQKAMGEWLQENFHADVQGAHCFQRREQTFTNWRNARNMANGTAVGFVFMHFPHAIDWFLNKWEAR